MTGVPLSGLMVYPVGVNCVLSTLVKTEMTDACASFEQMVPNTNADSNKCLMSGG